MSYRTRIKFGNITNLSDARYAAAAGFEYSGFCFDPSNSHYIPPVKAKEIMDWVTGNHMVGEFGDQTLEEIQTISDLLNIDVIEVNNHLLPDELPRLGKPIIKKTDVGKLKGKNLIHELTSYQRVADAFHFFSSEGNNAHSLLLPAGLFSTYKIIWGLPLDAGTVSHILDTYHPFAINLPGGSEEQAGLRDFDELDELIQKITLQ